MVLEILRNLSVDKYMSTAVKERPGKAAQLKRSLQKEREQLFVKLQEINRAIQEVETDTKKSEKVTLAKLRTTLGWSRNQLAHVMNASDRAIVNWEQGDPISPVYAAKLREIQSVYNELKQLMKPEEIGSWLLAEMQEFEGRTPADLISKGETGRLWASLFYLRSGMPD
jgi:DNA-binding transcriptional regulator YiaG